MQYLNIIELKYVRVLSSAFRIDDALYCKLARNVSERTKNEIEENIICDVLNIPTIRQMRNLSNEWPNIVPVDIRQVNPIRGVRGRL